MGNYHSASNNRKNVNRKKIHPPVVKPVNLINEQNRNSKYILPDFTEISRLQMQHYLFRHVFDGNYSAPGVDEILKTGGKILDVGCGPGTWILELASEYSRAEFYGEIKPRNTTFIRANILDGLPFENCTFDYVHIGFLGTSFTEEEWKTIVIPEIIRVTKPNCWIELYEADGFALNCGPCYRQIINCIQEELAKKDIDAKVATKFKDWLLLESNLENIHEEIRKQPVGQFGGRLASLMEENNDCFFQTMDTSLIVNLGINSKEFEEMLQTIHDEYNKYKTYINFHRIYAQKFI
ncbi:7758_t:CDS:2 [Diversispora eburnea]|uniref:7758_t:CDS:1 n=1 Tax=Diversispora eburnea TaxID=1213867 RepID=A0A9N8V5A8_9GLOM|nr:7758_t:CDS:2 [Diversispora eburnea]